MRILPLPISTFFRAAAVWACLAGLAACSGADVLNGLTSESGFAVRKDLAYGELPRQKLDLYLPAGANYDTPLVVFFYGGAWQHGSKDDYLFVAESLTSMGYAVAVPDYRLYPEARFPAFVEDAALAVAWARTHAAQYKLNPDNLYLMGHSAGAYNAVMLALDERYLRAVGGSGAWLRGVVGLAGPYDFLPMRDPAIRDIFASATDLSDTQPINFVRPRAPRMLLLTGLADGTVPSRNSYYLYGALRELTNDVTYREYAGIGHIDLLLELTRNFSNGLRLRRDVADFIDYRPAPAQ